MGGQKPPIFVPMESELIYKSVTTELNDLDEAKGIVKGIGSYYGNEDSDGDVMVKGCYEKSLGDRKGRIPYLFNHNMNQLVGKLELIDTERSLDFEAKLAVKTQLGKDVFELIKGGFLRENSVGFKASRSNMEQKSDGLNYIKEATLYEISAVTVASNPLATISGFKSEGETAQLKAIEYLVQRLELLEGLIKGNISDDLGHAVEFEMLQLKQFIPLLGVKSEEKQAEPKGEAVEKEVIKEETTKVIVEPTKEEVEAINTKGIFNYLYENLKKQ